MPKLWKRDYAEQWVGPAQTMTIYLPIKKLHLNVLLEIV